MTKAGFLLLIVSVLMPSAARAACVVSAGTTIPLQVIDDTLIVPVAVNGIEASFILATGAQRSVVSQDAVERLGLARDPWVGTTMSGPGGHDRRPNADPRTLSLGGVPLVRRTVIHDTSLTVAALPRTRAGNVIIDGLLGRDFLALFDLDMDMPNEQLTLYQVRGCTGRFLPWPGGYTQIPVSMPATDAMVVALRLDGRPLRALLDSGAGASLLGAPGMFRLGLRPASLAEDPAGQIAGAGSPGATAHLHTFRSLQVGDETIDAPSIWVAPIRLSPIVDMLLGADWLAGRRIWFSYSTRQVFATIP